MEAVRAHTCFFNISSSQTSNRNMFKCHLHILPSGDEVVVFGGIVNLGPILSCNDLTAVTFMGTCPMTLQVESCCCIGISRQTDTSSGNGVEIRGTVWCRGESSLETQ
ncbi:hypothetical protein PAMP_004844 [Pampus punctatissimus]